MGESLYIKVPSYSGNPFNTSPFTAASVPAEYKPFDRALALRGDASKFVTRDGRAVYSIALLSNGKGGQSLVAIIGETKNAANYDTTDGRFYASGISSNADLFVRKVEKIGWVNIYPEGYLSVDKVGSVYNSEAAADKYSSTNRVGKAVKITYSE